jgi:ribose 5-phosphate isomerase A
MIDLLKKKAAETALSLIKDNMIVGLGTGSTANFFIDGLIQKQKEGLNIRVVASSSESEKRAQNGSLRVLNINDVLNIDIVVDGADEIDFEKRMIKGGGGALLREKILASNAAKMVVIADSSKMVKKFGRPLPLEVTSYGYKFTKNTLEKMGFKSSLRMKNDKPFVTENYNYILDVVLNNIQSPEKIDSQLLKIVGVVETGFFLNFDPLLIISHSATEVEIIE